MIKTLLYRWLLPRLLAKPCEKRVPRSGKEGEEANCYFVALDRDELPYFMASAIEGDIVTGFKYDGNSYAEDLTISISDLENGTLNIIHY